MVARKWVVALATAISVSAIPQRRPFLPPSVHPSTPNSTVDETKRPDIRLFEDTVYALEVMQDKYFEPWVGTWPKAIDWTAAVMATHLSGALRTLDAGIRSMGEMGIYDFKSMENSVSLYFTELVAFYFGQDAFSLRNQAFDDMLWVVLGWLDTIQFIRYYSKAHYEAVKKIDPEEARWWIPWHGNNWSSAFAHRSRIFWHLASEGWDNKLCGGGMNWNPRLTPYKNAITNELYIAGSANMYLYFPGDANPSPFKDRKLEPELPGDVGKTQWEARDPKYLEAATAGYRWLAESNMVNDQGLYADGFHISGYNSGSNNTKCDQRDEMVYTYNQGVLLTGQRGLYLITADPVYLWEGHTLIQNVIRATGWDLQKDRPMDDLSEFASGRLLKWHGLGRAGVLEDACDATGSCSQDAQTFKGIWMHHFISFCSALEVLENGAQELSPDDNREHIASCRRYYSWLKHNADAARATRDKNGKFGMWWTVGLFKDAHQTNIQLGPDPSPKKDGATDYRNEGVPNNPTWVINGVTLPQPKPVTTRPVGSDEYPVVQHLHYQPGDLKREVYPQGKQKREVAAADDLNSRGRGRTVETQSGGLAVLRALWHVSNLPVRMVATKGKGLDVPPYLGRGE